jgi:hypothetical protein
LRALLRRRHLEECLVDRLRRRRLVDVDAEDANAGTIAVEQLLHVLLDSLLDLRPAGADRVLERHPRHRRPHRALRDFADRQLGLIDLEKESLRILDVPANRIG